MSHNYNNLWLPNPIFQHGLLLNLWPYATEMREPVCLLGTSLQVSVSMGFVVDKVAVGQVFPRVLRFSPVNFIPPELHYKEKRKKTAHLHHRVAQ